MKRTPVAHVVFPRPSAARPVLEFSWRAAEVLTETPDLDVSVLVPVPVPALRRAQSWLWDQRGAAGWPADLEARLAELEPTPTLVPYLPVPRRSIEAASVALAAHLIGRPRASRPRVVQGSFLDEGGYAAAALGRVLGVPSIAVAHGTDVRVAAGEVPEGVNRGRRARTTLGRADHVLTVSHPLAQTLALMGVRAEVLPFTSDPDRFEASARPDGPPEILFVGKVGRAKGVDRLLAGFAAMRRTDATLRLVGAAAGDVDISTEVARLGLTQRVTVEGERPQHELPPKYAAATCLALPSTAEGLPCVVVEALLSGRPVVATAVGGVPELVDAGVGALIDPAPTAEALASALDETIARAEAGQLDPEALRRRALPFSWAHTGPRLQALTRRLLGP